MSSSSDDRRTGGGKKYDKRLKPRVKNSPSNDISKNARHLMQRVLQIQEVHGTDLLFKAYLSCNQTNPEQETTPKEDVIALIKQMLDNEESNKEKLALLRSELLRKIRQKATLQVVVQVLRKQTSKLTQKNKQTAEVIRDSASRLMPLGASADGFLDAMKAVLAGEADQVSQKENIVQRLDEKLGNTRKRLEDCMKAQKQELGQRSDYKQLIDELRRFEQMWVKQLSLAMRCIPTAETAVRFSNFSRSFEQSCNLMDAVERLRADRDRASDRLRLSVEQNAALHDQLNARQEFRRVLEAHGRAWCADIERLVKQRYEQSGERPPALVVLADWSIDLNKGRNDCMVLDMQEMYERALTELDQGFRLILPELRRSSPTLPPKDSIIGRRLSERERQETEMAGLDSLMKIAHNEFERLMALQRDRRISQQKKMRISMMLSMTVQQPASVAANMALETESLYDELRGIRRRQDAQLDELEEELVKVKRRPEFNLSAFEKRLDGLIEKKSQLENTINTLMGQGQLQKNPRELEKRVLNLDHKYRRLLADLSAVKREIAKMRDPSVVPFNILDGLKRDLILKETDNKRLIEKASRLKSAVRMTRRELYIERERHIYHASDNHPSAINMQLAYVVTPFIPTEQGTGGAIQLPGGAYGQPLGTPYIASSPVPLQWTTSDRVSMIPPSMPALANQIPLPSPGKQSSADQFTAGSSGISTQIEESTGFMPSCQNVAIPVAGQPGRLNPWGPDMPGFTPAVPFEQLGDGPAEITIEVPQAMIKVVRTKYIQETKQELKKKRASSAGEQRGQSPRPAGKARKQDF